MNQNVFGETQYAQWSQEVLNDCLFDNENGLLTIDFELLLSKFPTEKEFKAAQIMMQSLAQDLKSKIGNSQISTLTGELASIRFVLAAVVIAYCENSGFSVFKTSDIQFPQELQQIITWNPIIKDCVEFTLQELKNK